jgi:hypothetical protein
LFSGVHDGEIVAYSVDSRARELTLVLAPGKGSAGAEIKLVFRGVIAHQFIYPELPSIVSDLEDVPVIDFVTKNWGKFSEGSRQCGWPGPWATSLDTAVAYCASEEIKAYELSESYGMFGWVLAKSVECINAP